MDDTYISNNIDFVLNLVNPENRKTYNDIYETICNMGGVINSLIEELISMSEVTDPHDMTVLLRKAFMESADILLLKRGIIITQDLSLNDIYRVLVPNDIYRVLIRR